MQLKIHQRKSDKNNTELYRKAVEFFAEELLSKSKRDKLQVSVVLKKFKGKNYKNDYGSCNQIDGSRNKYKIEINNIHPFHSIIATLAHEMVHVKQGVLGKLIEKKIGFVWKGTLYKNVDMKDTDVYNATEWEQDAYRLESELTKKFFKYVMIEEVKSI
jgi:hypothetical protein